MNLITEASEFLNISKKQVLKNIETATDLSIKDWENKKSIDGFYETTDFYIYGLIRYNKKDRLDNILFYTKYFKKGLDILDFGAGIGIIDFILANDHNMYYYDLESRTKEFTKFLNNKVENKINFVNETEMGEKQYDVIFLLDVLEHLENPMEIVYKMHKLLKPRGLLITSGLIFSVSAGQPMHLPENKKYLKEFNEFIKNNYTYKYFIQGVENVYGVEKNAK